MNNYSWSLDYLAHHGVKGQKWGIRRYQYADGSLTPMGRARRDGQNDSSITAKLESRALNRGSESSDRRLTAGTSLKRIQTVAELEGHPIYTTHEQDDNEKYLGLFGDNLKRRARRVGKDVEVYQLSISAKKNLSIPSDENACDIMSGMLKDKQFASDVKASIEHSKEIMRRPQQQQIFNRALDGMKDAENATPNQKMAIYKAYNLSLTNHQYDYETRSQEKFYGTLKKKGYEALSDYNDKEFSSYHAKDPVIVFDMDSVTLKSVWVPDGDITSALNKKYNAERLSKDAKKQVESVVTGVADMTMQNAEDTVYKAVNKYLNRR